MYLISFLNLTLPEFPQFGAKIQQNNPVLVCVTESKLFLMNIYKL